MTERAVQTVQLLAQEISLELEIRFEGSSTAEMKNWLGPDWHFSPQGPGDLGEKMHRAFADSFHQGYQQVITIGADCPALATKTLATAFNKLAEHDLVLGPATDGGYYLIGLSLLSPRLFADLPWGSSRVLQETLALAEKSDLSFFLLEELSDVDRPEDLNNFSGDPDPQ